MILRLCCLLAGLALVGTGASLARDELALIDARQAAREARPGQLAQSMPRLREAYRALDAADARGTDQLDLAIRLYGRGEADSGESLIVRSARVHRAADKLARSSPLDARAWCVLALAHSKIMGLTAAVIDELRACYAFGPREIGIIDGRLMFSWSAWENLPQDVRNAAMIDVAATLGDPQLGPWMASRLAYAVAAVDPLRAPLAETLLDTYGESLKLKYTQAVSNYRRTAAARNVTR